MDNTADFFNKVRRCGKRREGVISTEGMWSKGVYLSWKRMKHVKC